MYNVGFALVVDLKTRKVTFKIVIIICIHPIAVNTKKFTLTFKGEIPRLLGMIIA